MSPALVETSTEAKSQLMVHSDGQSGDYCIDEQTRNGCWQSHGQPDSLKQTHDASHWQSGTPNPLPRNDWCSHSCAATRAFPVLHPCSTPELLPTASSLYLILDFLHTGILPSAKVTVPSKGFERDCRLHLSGWAPAAPLSMGILARVGILADLAIPCFCLKPLSHTTTAPFHPPMSSVRRSALYPRAISSGQISDGSFYDARQTTSALAGTLWHPLAPSRLFELFMHFHPTSQWRPLTAMEGLATANDPRDPSLANRFSARFYTEARHARSAPVQAKNQP
ncbi:hypothetical protein NA56DRAFT_708601 [Hyaloscypha hepaticicola]|uniref:Uncharacterized protein n=1 Tax=Hyaloscypha hepaticicola TaxID=2082293 RepID=A0A2J6PRS3_9HELO|nr:hypothetical protein NA56DRAFT_708601 [Hyaloscypha hepaticicola]